MRDPREPLTTDGYQRPQQAWQCGLADEGPPCPLGPTGSGHCPAMAACRPVREGERWHCNRSPLRGGPCADGPGHEGGCPIVYRCTPVRSLRTRRGRFIVGVAVAAIGAACMALSGSWRNELIAPGPISVHHAQLLNGENATLRCAQCHAAGEASIAEWWKRSTSASGQGVTQPMLCVACHSETVDREFALAAHGVAIETLAGAGGGDAPARLEDRLRDPRESIACSTCHREHQGLNHNLVAMSNDACQACHRQQYDRFAGDHPDFAGWPYQRRTRIAFDHASHQAKHYPSEKQPFTCAACHQPDATGERQLTSSYATTCAECHDKSIATSLADGVPLMALPTLDVDALSEAGHDMGPWPDDATGDFEGAAPMPAALLLAANPQLEDALIELGPSLDLYDVDPDDAQQLRAAAAVGGGYRALTDDLAERGQAAVSERLSMVLGREVAGSELVGLAGGLSPDVARAYRDRWFAKPQAADGGQGDRAAELGKVIAGGWVRDDLTFSLRYRPVGHADPWLRAWLDVLTEAASGPNGARFEPLLRAAMKPTAPGQCGSCHSVDRAADGRLAIQWRPFEPADEPRSFTRFSHGPHVMQRQTGDCASCHRISANGQTAASYAGDDPQEFVAGFEAMSKATCAACHTASAAGDSCMQCHTYHGEKSVGGSR